MNLEPISLEESKRLIALETTIRNGEAAFIEVGTALIEIRESKLYRNVSFTFEGYCQDTFGWSARRGRQLMAAAAIVDEMKKSGTSGSALPKTERQARKAISERKPICDTPAKTPPPVVDVEPEPPTIDDKWREATGMSQPPSQKPVQYESVQMWYSKMELFITEAFEEATDKQLISMSVYAATVPKLIKEEIRRRAQKQ